MAARLPMNVYVRLLLFLCTVCLPCWARSYNEPRRSPPVSPGVAAYPMHGPGSDDQDLPRDLRKPYPGKNFGPMGPIDRKLPDDASLRTLEDGSIVTRDAADPHPPAVSQREYQVFTVEFHRVETPFVIGIWIFFASLAKIGERCSSSTNID